SACKDESQLLGKDEKLIYQSIVGSLMYDMVYTHSDLAFTLSRLSKYCSAPGRVHMQAARHALRYLRSTTSLGITYKAQRRSPIIILEGFRESDYAGDTDNR